MSTRVAYTYSEFAALVGKSRKWTYRQVKAGRIRSVTNLGISLIPASEIQRLFEEVAP